MYETVCVGVYANLLERYVLFDDVVDEDVLSSDSFVSLRLPQLQMPVECH